MDTSLPEIEVCEYPKTRKLNIHMHENIMIHLTKIIDVYSYYIYVPIKTTSGHWYLKIVHLEHQTIYQLDSLCPLVVSEWRKLCIKKVVIIIITYIYIGNMLI
jgi:hypothetical protein